MGLLRSDAIFLFCCSRLDGEVGVVGKVIGDLEADCEIPISLCIRGSLAAGRKWSCAITLFQKDDRAGSR
jgi:hypothetical protein